ncbi:MAG: PEP-CTERM sorting domain-containing protein [Verrucomicrobia bacterium]|nr:PEP-CTERM sorting domain-containing protein [Verrucomicrobiota bacterium]
MKKYITLAALLAAGTACANAASNDLSISPGGNFWGGDFSFGFTIDTGTLSDSDKTDVLALYWGTYSDANYYSNGFNLTYTNDGIELYVGDGAMANVGASADVATITETTTFTGARGATFNTLLTVGESYVIKNVGGDGNQTVSLYAATWDSAQEAYLIGTEALETVTYNGNMNGGNANTTMGSVVNSAYSVSTNITVVPEPSAFGLLAGVGALALVASRRRRR